MSTTGPELGRICIQVHPRRAPALDVARLAEVSEAVGRRTPGIRGINISEGEEDGVFVNILFAAVDPLASWPALKEALLESAEFRDALKLSCMCLCTGDDGWDDYLLLYHFDPTVPLDDLAAGAGGE
ncbi:hypothetical protein [Roseateles sp. P5_E7]